MEEKIDNYINNINQIFINELYNHSDNFNKAGEKELFNDFIETYLRAYKMLKNNKLMDGLIIARSSFEILMILIGIHINKKCAEEYFRSDRYERYQQRRKENSEAEDYMSQNYLRKIVKNRCKNVENELNEIYKFLSLYAHPTIYRNILRNIEKQKIDISKIYFNAIIAIPVIALLIFNDLNIIKKDIMLDMINLKQWIEVIVSKYELTKINKVQLNRIEPFMYKDINQEFYNKNEEQQKKELVKIQNEFNKNKLKMEELYKKTANKLEYNGIYNVCLEILKEIK